MSRQFILQIETATRICSVALSADGDTLLTRSLDEPNVHTSQLTLLIEEVLGEAALSVAQLAAVAVSKGPGSYTGLRIGVSTAKGLCYAADLPLIAVETLMAMANGFLACQTDRLATDSRLCPMIDARRMEVYTTVYDMHLQAVKPTEAVIVDAHTFDDLKSGENSILFGSGADKFEALFANHAQVTVVPGFFNSAAYLSPLAYRLFSTGAFEDLAYFEPYYLKDFVATTPKKC